MNDKELEITLNDDNTISFSDYINTRIAYETVCQEKDKEIERLNNIINKVYKYLDEKKDVPEWWDTDFMICMDILKGGTGYLKDILGSDKE